ncbi:MAG TPA: VWA domain-containing protein [Bryobacteraceae bacterium]|nr:VWA domain-containing protein [Bryobacteraceae bacterium]
MPFVSTRRAFLCSAAALCPVRRARGQQEPVFSTEVKVVNVLATVRDKKGAIISSLGQDDFSIAEDGRPQSIRYFARDTDLPLTIGLMVDTSASQRRVLDAERGASYRFFEQVLREDKDQVFIMQFDSAVQLRQPLTSSFKKLTDSLAYVDTETMNELRIQNGGGTLLYDAVAKASDEIMKNRQGRKALILLTDGVDFGSYGTADDAIAAAQRADTLVFSILYSDPGAYGPFGGPNGRGVLERISSETGGGFFEVSKRQTVDKIFEELETELRSQYSLGFVSDKPVTLSQFRTLHLTVKPKGLVVQSRNRYWARP